MSTMHYGDPAYWEERYQQEGRSVQGFRLFDFYVGFDEAWPMIESSMVHGTDSKVLVAGCGKSNTCEVLYRAGFHSITAFDISPTVVTQMTNHCRSLEGLKFMLMDARRLDALLDESFHLIIDKALMDAVFCNITCFEQIDQMLGHMFRILAPSGTYAVASQGTPNSRLPYLRKYGWQIDMFPIPRSEGVHLYIMTKPDETGHFVERHKTYTAPGAADAAGGEVVEEQESDDEGDEQGGEEASGRDGPPTAARQGVGLEPSRKRSLMFGNADELLDDNPQGRGQSYTMRQAHSTGVIRVGNVSSSLIDMVRNASAEEGNLAQERENDAEEAKFSPQKPAKDK